LQGLDELRCVVTLVGTQCDLGLGVALTRLGYHGFGRFAFSVAIGLRDHGAHHQAMAVLHQRVAHEAQLAGCAFHWQPVRNTNTMASNTWRAGFAGRPAPGLRTYCLPGTNAR